MKYPFKANTKQIHIDFRALSIGFRDIKYVHLLMSTSHSGK